MRTSHVLWRQAVTAASLLLALMPAAPSPALAQSADTPPAGYFRCAGEGQACAFSGAGNVVYGALGSWTAPRGFTGGTLCGNAVFGDPLFGVVKACYVQVGAAPPPAPAPAPTTDTPPAGYARCAAEGQNCAFTGTANVVYGALGTWTSPRSFTGGTACTNAVFGDPLFNTAKSCYQAASAPVTKALTVTVSGAGGIGLSDGSTTASCTATCTKTFNAGANVTLAATPAAGQVFAGWGGACSGTGACAVSLAGDAAVSATFNAAPVASAGKTYFVSTSGNDSANGTSLSTPFKTINKAVGVAKAGDTIEVRAGTYAEAVVIRTAGRADAWITLRGYNGERPVIRRTGAGPTVWFYNSLCDEDAIGNGSGNTDCLASHWVLSGLEIQGSSNGGGDGNAVKIDTAKVRLVGNKLCCSAADIVKLVRTANDVEVLDNEIWQNAAVTVPTANAQAVDIVGADRTRVANNHIHDVPDIGIYSKGNSRNTLIEGNLLVNMGTNALMLGQSTDDYRLVDGLYETYDGIIRNNVVVNSGWACLATSSSQRVRIHNNSCFNTGTTVHGSILLSNESEVRTPGQDIEIFNNIVYGSANRPVLVIKDGAVGDARTLKVDKNIYYVGGGAPKFSVTLSGTTHVLDVATWRTNYKSMSGRDDTSLVADPKYASTTGSASLTLQSGSPAINAGLSNTAAVPTDKAGLARPQGPATDIGAYEVAGSAPVASHLLSVAVSGNGAVGISTGSGNSVSCTGQCNNAFPAGTQVTLAAVAVSGNTFTGWGGACSGTAANCTVGIDAAKSVTATFAASSAGASTHALALTFSGNGAGAVSLSSDGAAGGSCASSCSKTYDAATVVTLAATPSAGSTFTGWSGGACSGTAGCVLTMSQSRAVTAAFATATAPADTAPPTVTAKSPAAGATGASPGGTVSVTFSEAVNCSTVTASSLAVNGVAGTVACSGNTASFKPNSPLAANASYTATVGTGVKDLAGNALAAGVVWSFTTGSDSQFTFLAYGDSRSGNGCSGNAVHLSLVNRMVAEPASLMFNLGDMVTGYDSSTNWVQRGACPEETSKGSLKEIIAPLQNKAPAPGLPQFFFPVVGNHDDHWADAWYPDKFGNGFCDVFKPAEFVPNHTQKSYFLDKSGKVPRYTDAEFQSSACSKIKAAAAVYSSYMYYSFDFKNTHFVVMHLNNDYRNLEECNGCTDPNNYQQYYYKHQLDWLKSDLAGAGARQDIQHIVVLLHTPLFSSSDGHAPNVSWPVLSKLFSSHKVRMVLQGHNHVYERSHPITASAAAPAGVRDDANGTIYTTTGGGGSELHYFNSQHPLMAVQKRDFHYLRIDVNGPTVSVKAIKPDGSILDSYSR